ncbi:hypothetical protein [Aeromicrobium alkaliterrae]|uniref:Uncharacterized protein n=1 Tax=Aeromicrobium alkaliterrae TaxID=302168 RepID=A0ABN2JNW5_9ACTN
MSHAIEPRHLDIAEAVRDEMDLDPLTRTNDRSSWEDPAMKSVARRLTAVLGRVLTGAGWLVTRTLTIAGAVFGQRGNPVLPPDHAPLPRREYRP